MSKTNLIAPTQENIFFKNINYFPLDLPWFIYSVDRQENYFVFPNLLHNFRSWKQDTRLHSII